MEPKKFPERELFQRTFSKLTASPLILQEVITMTESKKKPKKFILRRLVVAALVLALVFALAMGANAATGGKLFHHVATFLTYSEDGTTIALSVDVEDLKKLPPDTRIAFGLDGVDGHKVEITTCKEFLDSLKDLTPISP